jgi:hypothetical protein
MVSKIRFFTAIILICFLGACARTNAYDEEGADISVVVTSGINDTEQEDINNFDTNITNESLPVSESIEIQVPHYVQNEEDINGFYLDGEFVPFDGIGMKFTFNFGDFYDEINDKYWQGTVTSNWGYLDYTTWEWRILDDTLPMTSGRGSSDIGAGWFSIEDNRIVMQSEPGSLRELTTTQWDEWGIQIFELSGDMQLISMPGVLSEIPELQEDNFLFRLYVDMEVAQREIQYILYHEREESELLHLLGVTL